MKINDNKSPSNLAQSAVEIQKQVRPGKGLKLSEEKEIQDGDQVSISPEARLIEQIQSAVDQVPDGRQDKIEYFKKQIQEGTYKVEPEKVAEEMIQSLLDEHK
jgi:flagellar biosynthesis anti-sigma factor FlgM